MDYSYIPQKTLEKQPTYSSNLVLCPNYASLNGTLPKYRFERVRLGNKTLTQNGEKYGPYLYRDTKHNILIASWDKPTKGASYLYTGADIGCNADALRYYKNV